MGGERGFALVVVLLVTALLVSVVVEFVYAVYVSTSMVANYRDSQRASVLAATGVEMAQAAIEILDRTDPYRVTGGGGIYYAKSDEDTVLELRITDESSRVSLAVVYPATGAVNNRVHDVYSRLLSILGRDPELVETLADWIDVDDEPRLSGAETYDYYATLPDPYRPRNAMPVSVDELYMIKGYTPEVVRTIKPFVTVYGDGLVNINRAGKEVLMALSGDMDESLAERIIEYRASTPFRDRADVMKVPGFETIGFSLQDRIKVRGDTFRVFSRATAGDAVREVEAVIRLGGGVLYWREG
ncbi:MAG TPA: general secretion pathway protein GspK [Deltaproteobacteria bacterium]|nr:general secretion pathway protein GspK [Deltaproteobacteria bacterium]